MSVGYGRVVVGIEVNAKIWLDERHSSWYVWGGGCQQVFVVFRCMWLVTFDALRRFATEFGGITKLLAVEGLSYSTAVSKFFPFDNSVAEFMNLDHFANVCVGGR